MERGREGVREGEIYHGEGPQGGRLLKEWGLDMSRRGGVERRKECLGSLDKQAPLLLAFKGRRHAV